MIDSKDVNNEIRKTIFPLLRNEGFSKFNSRSAWKISDKYIQVINFQSFNTYLASRIGCTPHSFAINLGVFIVDVEPEIEKLPLEWECHFRKQPRKSINQEGLFNTPHLNNRDNKGVWLVLDDGSNLNEVIRGVVDLLPKFIDWFNEVSDTEKALDILKNREDSEDEDYGGGLGSPNRVRWISAITSSKS